MIHNVRRLQQALDLVSDVLRPKRVMASVGQSYAADPPLSRSP